MKVLFYPLIDHTKIEKPRFMCDYMVDCVFHGLRSLLGEDCVDVYTMHHMYNTYKNPIELYGNGFTIFAQLDEILIDRTDIDSKIERGYFDLIVAPIHNNQHLSPKNIEAVKWLTSKNKVKVIDGNDDIITQDELLKFCTCFKRELRLENSFYPISFAIPESKVIPKPTLKFQTLSTIFPQFGGRKTWTYTREQDYYNEYHQSIFAHTCAKGGWDCMRHYEILACGCIPLFFNLESCPPRTLTTLPKEKLIHIWNNASTIDIYDTIEELLDYTRKHLTTISLAKYILEAE